LSNANLRAADLTRAGMGKANLTYSIIGEANLSYANLSGADLTSANLVETDLTGANLTDAILIDAKVSKSSTKGVDFDEWKKRGGIVLRDTNFIQSITPCIQWNNPRGGVKIQAQENIDCWIRKMKTGEKLLTYAIVWKSNLSGMDLSNVDLFGSDFSNANCSNVNFSGANLRDVQFDNANLTNANFVNTNLFQTRVQTAILTGAIISRKTNLGVDFEWWKKQGGIVVD
jgi:uncharacterized protein YjbI with pentapeptide repeats